MSQVKSLSEESQSLEIEVSSIAFARQGEIDVCITVTLTDGVVVARSAFHHSLNYRSVVALGKAQAVTDSEEKAEALNKITNHLLPGRVPEVYISRSQNNLQGLRSIFKPCRSSKLLNHKVEKNS